MGQFIARIPGRFTTHKDTLVECHAALADYVEKNVRRDNPFDVHELEFEIKVTRRDKTYGFGACGATALHLLCYETIFLRETKILEDKE